MRLLPSRWQGQDTWNILRISLARQSQVGLHANRPKPIEDGQFYYETDTSTLFVSSGGAWKAT